jgi:transglutaminase-like putative cysteine protease
MRTALAGFLIAAATLFEGCAAVSAPAGAAAARSASLPPSVYSLVDLWAVSATESEASTIGSLAAYLARPEFSEEEKARALFRWTAGNVRYDLAGFEAGTAEALPPEEVLRRRAAVCDGYAGLFNALAETAGLEAVTIRGYAKGEGYSAGRPFRGAPNHAWNAVRVPGRWLLLDCTWAAGVLNERGGYEAAFDPYFFDVPPSELILTHFPADPQWQLLDPPLTQEAFEGLPYVKTPFFECGLRLDSHKSAWVRAQGALFRVSLMAPQGTSVLASLVRRGEEMRKGRVAVLQEGNRRVIWVLSPEPGEYTLRIFATRGDPRGPHRWVLDYAVTAEAGAPSGTVEEALAKSGLGAGRATGRTS